MDTATVLDPSAEAYIAGLDRLKNLRLDAYIGRGIGAEGMVYLRLSTSGGSTACPAPGIPFDDLAAACDAFNERLAGHAVAGESPMAARRRRNKLASAIGDMVRDMVMEGGL